MLYSKLFKLLKYSSYILLFYFSVIALKINQINKRLLLKLDPDYGFKSNKTYN